MTASRRPDRPGVRELLHHAATGRVDAQRNGPGRDRPRTPPGASTVRGHRVRVARTGPAQPNSRGTPRPRRAPTGPPRHAAGRRPGPAPGHRDRHRGRRAVPGSRRTADLAGEIARCIADMLALEVPTASVLLGQGTGGGALALVAADRILAAQHGSLIPRFPSKAPARSCTTTPATLRRWRPDKECDRQTCWHTESPIVSFPELPDAADEPQRFCARVGAVLQEELAALDNVDTKRRLARRAQRLDRIGRPDPVLARTG